MRLVRMLMLLGALVAAGMAQALAPDQPLHQYLRGNWSIQQGLPQISVLAIAQDHEGYLWVGTQAGLARFDGVRFVTFTSESTPELPGNWVGALKPSRDGRLWIGTYKGVAVYDGDGFTQVPAEDADDQALALDTRAFAEDAKGRMWAATTTGVYRVEDDQLKFVPGSPEFSQSLLARADSLWVGARGAVHVWKNGKWQQFPLPKDASTASVNRLVEAQGRVWAATALGLYVLGDDGWVPFAGVPQLAQLPVDMLQADNDGNLWAGGDAGLARIREGRLESFVGPTDPGGLVGLRSAFEDREGSLWFGSQWEGLTRLGDSWTQHFSIAEGLNDPIVWSVSPDPDGSRIWVGTNDGLSLLESGRLKQIVSGSDLPHPHAYNLLAEKNLVWVGTRRGLVVVDVSNIDDPKVRRPENLRPLAGAQINGIVRMRPDHALWIATTEGLYELPASSQSSALPQLRAYGQEQGLTDSRIRILAQARDGRILVGTQSGLFQQENGRFAPVPQKPGLPDQLDVTAIHQLDDGRLVIGALNEQIYLLDADRWHPLGEAQGMPSNAPFYLTSFDGYLWVAGIRGIARVAIAELDAIGAGRIERVHGEMLLNERGDPNSGQQGYCCNGAGNSKGFHRGDTLWLPTRDGVLSMDVSSITKNAVAPGVVIERVQVGDDWRPIAAVRGTTLPSGARDLSFEFTVLSFPDPESTGVQYRLQGYDRNWQNADPLNRSARYTNLPPGDYVLEVRGTNNDGVASLQPALMAFSVRPYFHETAGFLAILGLLLAALIYLGYLYQRYRHRLQQRALEAVVQQRTEALEVANQRLQEVSQTDPLTGLHNRRYVTDQIPADLAYYDRKIEQGAHENEVMLFALVDIDHFKSVNDQHGHHAGDLVLQQLAQVLNGLVRTGDYVVRWGGEEFLLIFRPMPMRNLQIIGERLCQSVRSCRFDLGNGQHLNLTCSAGISEYPLFRSRDAKLGWESMIELADQALYYVKSHGRDGWAAFRPTPKTDLRTLVEDLQQGPDPLLQDGDLQLISSKNPTTDGS